MFTKKHNFNVRMDDEERARLMKLANELGLNVTDTVRYCVKQTHDLIIPKTRA